MTELIDNREYRIRVLKDLVMDLHKGRSLDDVKKRFAELVRDVSPQEISAMEQALIQEGMPVREVQRLCDVHAALFKGALQKTPEPSRIPGHPLHTFVRENRAIERLIDAEVKPRIDELASAGAADAQPKALELAEKVNLLFDVEKHYKRKEELLFPHLEKHGLYGPAKVMWGADDEIRESLRELKELLAVSGGARRDEAVAKARKVTEAIKEMIFKEEKILLPTAEQNLTEDDWYGIYQAENEIGYCLVEPEAPWNPRRERPDGVVEPGAAGAGAGDVVRFSTGMLRSEEIELILNHLPVDITFVDKDDTVRYFSSTKGRIFTRPRTIIGRKVQNCHPPASVHVVEGILRSFKDGKKDVEEFWIELGGRLVYIRYFAVRGDEGQYVGTLEVTQDITHVKTLEGEKRLV